MWPISTWVCNLLAKLLETGRWLQRVYWKEKTAWTKRRYREGAGCAEDFLLTETVWLAAWMRLRNRIGPGKMSCPYFTSIFIHLVSLQVTNFQLQNIQCSFTSRLCLCICCSLRLKSPFLPSIWWALCIPWRHTAIYNRGPERDLG